MCRQNGQGKKRFLSFSLSFPFIDITRSLSLFARLCSSVRLSVCWPSSTSNRIEWNLSVLYSLVCSALQTDMLQPGNNGKILEIVSDRILWFRPSAPCRQIVDSSHWIRLSALIVLSFHYTWQMALAPLFFFVLFFSSFPSSSCLFHSKRRRRRTTTTMITRSQMWLGHIYSFSSSWRPCFAAASCPTVSSLN